MGWDVVEKVNASVPWLVVKEKLAVVALVVDTGMARGAASVRWVGNSLLSGPAAGG